MAIRLLLLLLLFAPGWSFPQESTESKTESKKKEQQEPSLAELARRERERRAQRKQKLPVITNATIGNLRGRVSGGGAALSDAAPGSAAPASRPEAALLNLTGYPAKGSDQARLILLEFTDYQ